MSSMIANDSLVWFAWSFAVIYPCRCHHECSLMVWFVPGGGSLMVVFVPGGGSLMVVRRSVAVPMSSIIADYSLVWFAWSFADLQP